MRPGASPPGETAQKENREMSEKIEKHENKVTLTVITLSGNYSDDFNVHQRLQHVVDKTFEELTITPAPGEQWVLRYNNVVLDLARTIGDAGIPDGATLELAPVEGGGGAAWTEK